MLKSFSLTLKTFHKKTDEQLIGFQTKEKFLFLDKTKHGSFAVVFKFNKVISHR